MIPPGKSEGGTTSFFEIQVNGFLSGFVWDSLHGPAGRLKNWEWIRTDDAVTAGAVSGYQLKVLTLSPDLVFCGSHPADLLRDPFLVDFYRLQALANARIPALSTFPTNALTPNVSEAAPLNIPRPPKVVSAT